MPKSICNKIADPIKRKRCLERFRSEQSEGAPSGDEAVKKISKRGSKKIKSGRY